MCSQFVSNATKPSKPSMASQRRAHQIELRVDHRLVERFDIGGQFPGPDPGLLIAVPEDDVDGQRLHEYRMTADQALEVSLPVKAGTRLVSVGFSDVSPSPEVIDDQPGNRHAVCVGSV